MNYIKNNLTNTFRGKRIDKKATIAIVSGLAVGAAIGALFATSRGRELRGKLSKFSGDLFNRITGNTANKTATTLASLVLDVREHVKKNAEGLLGPEKRRQNPTAISVDQIPSASWKDKPTHQPVNHQPNVVVHPH